MSFSAWLTSFSMITPGSIHANANDIILFFHGRVVFHCIYMYHIFFIHSSVNGHLGCVHVLAIVKVLQWTLGYMHTFESCFSGHMPKNGIIGSYGSSIFSFLRSLHTVLLSGYINLHSHQQLKRFPFLHTLFSIYCSQIFEDGHSDWLRWHIIVVLTLISLIISDAKHP